jgi:hypothetical protein
MTLVGMSEHYQPGGNAGIPSQWSRFGPFIGHVTNEIPGVSYGVVYNVDANNSFDYLCGVEVSAVADVPAGCVVLRVPASTHAVFLHRGTSRRSRRPSPRSGNAAWLRRASRPPTRRCSSAMTRRSTRAPAWAVSKSGCR